MSTLDPRATPRKNPGGMPRWLIALVAIVTVIVGGTAVGVLWTNRGSTTNPPVITPAPSASATVPSPSATLPSIVASPPSATIPSAATTTTSTATATATTSSVGAARAIPVYYLADVANGPRLYREFHALPLLNGSPAFTAVTEMLRGTPVDADYRSLWPTTVRVLSLTVVGDTARADLSGFVAVGASFEEASVQQLVYTVTAAEPAVHQVRLLVNAGLPPSGHMVWSDPVSRANAFSTVADVWILGPLEGSTVTSPVAVSVYGTGYEGNVVLRVFQSGHVVASTVVTTMMGGYAEARTTITLAPGSYELRAYNGGGLEDSEQLWDTKTFVVS